MRVPVHAPKRERRSRMKKPAGAGFSLRAWYPGFGRALGQQPVGEFLVLFDHGEAILQGFDRGGQTRRFGPIEGALRELAAAFLGQYFEISAELFRDGA